MKLPLSLCLHLHPFTTITLLLFLLTLPNTTPTPNSPPNSPPYSPPNSPPNSPPYSLPNSPPNSLPNSPPNSLPNSLPNSPPNTAPNTAPNTTPNSPPNSTSTTRGDVFRLHPKFPPISEQDIIRGLSPHGYRGNMKKLHSILKKAVAKQSLSVVVIGGSMPYGAGLEPHAFRDCWPTQMMHMLKALLSIKVSVNNLAIRAVSSDSQAQFHFSYIMNHVKRGVDLILVDIGFNDKPHHDPEFKEHVTYFEDADRLSRAAKEAAIIKERKKQGEGRLLMQLLLRHIPATTGIMYFETFVGGGKTSPIIHSPQDIADARLSGLTDGVYEYEESPVNFDCHPDVGKYYHFQALVEYKIPIFSYPDTICPIHNNSYWGGIMHHSKEYHKFTAYLLALSIFHMSKSDVSETKFDSELPFPIARIKAWNNYIHDPSTDDKLTLDSKLVDCVVTPLSYMAVNRPAKFVPVKKGADWRYYMDVEGKPGWIADAVVDPSNFDHLGSVGTSREIVFPVVLSTNQPMLRLSFLRSYNASMGKLRCCVSESPEKSARCSLGVAGSSTFEFNGLWSDETSQGVAVAVHLSSAIINVSGKAEKKGSTGETKMAASMKRNVVCKADGGKFKIIGVVGC